MPKGPSWNLEQALFTKERVRRLLARRGSTEGQGWHWLDGGGPPSSTLGMDEAWMDEAWTNAGADDLKQVSSPVRLSRACVKLLPLS